MSIKSSGDTDPDAPKPKINWGMIRQKEEEYAKLKFAGLYNYFKSVFLPEH